MGKVELSRRAFIKSAGAAGALAAMGGGLSRLLDRTDVTAKEKDTPKDEVPKLIPTVCGMCDVKCGVLAYVQGDRLLKIEGNYNHSHSLGEICPRGIAGVKLLYSQQRLRFPLKRIGERKFLRISWQQAFTEIGDRLRNMRESYGAESLAWAYHSHLSEMWDQQFMKAFASPNIFSQVSKYNPSRTIACKYTLGGTPAADFANSKYILILGHDPGESIFVSELAVLMEAKENGAHIVVVDPRMSRIATQAHEWIPIRPGTDGALLMALVNVVVSENLYDVDFIAKHTLGFEELKSSLSDATPGWASLITGIPAENIERLAMDLAAARPTCVVDIGFHSPCEELYANSFQTARAALALNALMGNYGAEGGIIMPPANPCGNFELPEPPPIMAKRVDGAGDASYPLASDSEGIIQLLPEIILSENPYPVKALIVNHHNPALSLPNTDKALKALRNLDLLVVIDVQGTETAELAHYILPESTYLERYDPLAVSERLLPEIALRQPVVKPLFDTKPAYEIITGMANAMRLGEFFAFTLKDVLKAQLRPTGLNIDQMKRVGVWRQSGSVGYGIPEFKTRSGKVELYSASLGSADFNPLPSYQPPMVTPDAHSFRLLHGHEALHTGTSTQNNPWLNALSPENALWINKNRAVRLDIRQGDWVRVGSEVGAVKVKAKVTEAIHPEAVFLVHGFGHNTGMQRLSYGKGANDNNLVADRAEPFSGSAVLNETIVTVERAS